MNAPLHTFYFNVNGMEYEVVAESKFAAKQKLNNNPNIPTGPRLLMRSEPYIAKSVNPAVVEG